MDTMEYSYKPTTHGRNVMAACMALEKPLKITRVAFGSGKVGKNVNLADVHELLKYVSEGAVAERRHEDDRFYLTVQFANQQHPEVKTFLLSEFIVYVENPETGEDTDLIYGTLGDYRQPVPGYNPAFPPSVFNFPLTLILSDEINVAVSAPSGLVTHDELLELLNRIRGDVSVIKRGIIIPTDGWTSGADEASGETYLDIPQSDITAEMIPLLHIKPTHMETARNCGFSNSIQTLEGAIRVYAKFPPPAPIETEITLIRAPSGSTSINWDDYALPIATASRAGVVRPGKGLLVDAGGVLSVDTASEEEVNELLAGDSHPDNK